MVAIVSLPKIPGRYEARPAVALAMRFIEAGLFTDGSSSVLMMYLDNLDGPHTLRWVRMESFYPDKGSLVE